MTDNETVVNVPYADAPAFGTDHVLTRIANGSLRDVVPLLDPNEPGDASRSAYLDRERLADALAAINADAGNTLDERLLAAIRRDAVFVVTGQQPGLLLGPMYTLLKAVSAIGLARRLGAGLGVPVIPAFWIAGEDHDLAEVNRCYLRGKKQVLSHSALNTAVRPPVARVSLEPHRNELLSFVREQLGGEPHAAFIEELVSSARCQSYTTHFADLLARLLGRHGLVLIDPMRMRELFAPVLAGISSRWSELTVDFSRGSASSSEAGLATPLDRFDIFEFTDSGRVAVDDPASIADRVIAEPELFSPSAALRPIVQDATIPTIATVAGPTEIQYLWQIDPLYETLGVSRSATWPRITATFVDRQTAALGERFGLAGDAILTVLERESELASEVADTHGDLKRVEMLGAELVSLIGEIMREHDSKPVRKAHESIEYQVRRVIDRVTQERAERRGVGPNQLRTLVDTVYPDGAPQERRLSPLEVLAAKGPDWVDWLLSELDATELSHALVMEG